MMLPLAAVKHCPVVPANAPFTGSLLISCARDRLLKAYGNNGYALVKPPSVVDRDQEQVI